MAGRREDLGGNGLSSVQQFDLEVAGSRSSRDVIVHSQTAEPRIGELDGAFAMGFPSFVPDSWFAHARRRPAESTPIQ
jgi:hypothetical protein